MNVIGDDGTEIKVGLCRSTLDSGAGVRLCVTGSSMVPALWPGDLVEVRRWTRGDLRVGEIVVFEQHRRLVIHRIAEVLEGPRALHLVTRGDAQRVHDQAVELSELLGVVSAIGRCGNRRAPSRRPHLAARGFSYVIGRSEWARRLSLHLYRFASGRLAGGKVRTLLP